MERFQRRAILRPTILALALCALPAWSTPAPCAIAAFPLHGASGAAGRAADDALRRALTAAHLHVISIDLEPSDARPFGDDGDADARLAARAADVVRMSRSLTNLAGVVVGPSRRIADAAAGAAAEVALRAPLVAVAPLSAAESCVCPSESELLRRQRDIVIESTNGAFWRTPAGAFRTFGEAASGKGTVVVADRDGLLFLDRRDGAGRETRLPLTTWTVRDVAAAALRAARRIAASRADERAAPPQKMGRIPL